MRALIDTNVLLDTIFRREPFHIDSDRIFDMIHEEKIKGCISVQSLKDIFYICKKIDKNKNPFKVVEKLSFVFEVVDVIGQDSVMALMSPMDDFEDGLLVFSARRNNIEAIITRNGRDFHEADIIVIDPKDIEKYFDFVETGESVIDNIF